MRRLSSKGSEDRRCRACGSGFGKLGRTAKDAGGYIGLGKGVYEP